MAAGQSWAQGNAPVHVRGQIAAIDGKVLTVKERSGQTLRLMLGDKSRVGLLKKASLAGIKTGAFIGTAAVPGAGGKLVAKEVLIFPPPRAGTGEGHRPWDLTSDSTMTNAYIEGVKGGGNGRELMLKYKGGTKTVLVPDGTPIIAPGPAKANMLKPGQHIFAVARKQADGSYGVVRLSFGADGMVPPM